MKSVSMDDIKNILENPSAKIIDIRDNYRYQLGTIPGAINIPSNFLRVMPEKYLDKNTQYYLLCDYGITSQKLAMFLQQSGYAAASINGGYHSYH